MEQKTYQGRCCECGRILTTTLTQSEKSGNLTGCVVRTCQHCGGTVYVFHGIIKN